MNGSITRRGFLGGTMGAGLGLAAGLHRGLGTAMDATDSRLLHRIDCTQDYPADQYFDHGAVTVTESAAGRYREAEAQPLSRFGYRFAIEHTGKPHVAVIRYPDDKRRYMCIMDGTTYDLTTGVFTGWEQPLSGSMLELHQIFWPRWTDCSIVFMTWGEGEPAAAASIEIRELDALPALDVPGDPGDGSRRVIGIQYEDPCGCCASEGAMNRPEWIDHVVQYARHSGQNLLAYPMAWYHGPQFPCACQPADGLGMAVARDRRQYVRWTTQPEDWYAALLERFGREGLGFQGALTLMRLGTLLENMNIDLAAIQAGADTYNNMLWNNHVQASTNDWTTLYNARNFDTIAEKTKQGPSEPFAALPGLAYGERPDGACHTGPMFNPLHPTVQEAILAFVTEIGQRYARFPAFKGISFNMFASAMPWFGSIHVGYDDYTTRLFEDETGIAVRVDPKAPDRFSRRYDLLTYVCRPAWVAWRCRKIRELFGRIHDALAAAREDLRVTATLWDETVVINTLGAAAGGMSGAHQLHARQSMLDLYREAGIDLDLYGDKPGLEVDFALGNSRDRGGHGARPMGGVNLPPEDLCMYRDFDYLDREALDAVAAHARPGAFVFNCWVEAWGRHTWFQPEPGDPNLATLSILDGKPAHGILRANSDYPKDDFWFDSQLRITPAFPAAPHFLEPYAHALAQLDACRITRGGLFLDKAHTGELRRFARPFRALPNEKFATVGTQTDPVAVRTLVRDGRRYLYAVNREYYPVAVQLAFAAPPGRVEDLADGAAVDAGQAWRVELGPYGLRAFALPADAAPTGCTVAVPDEIVRALTEQVDSALQSIASVRSRGKFVPGMDEAEAGLRSALADGRYAWLRRALTGYIVRKCAQMTA
ncbi:MAG: hypothetical protein JXR94_12495 [Candidatus Hydrogenedentes bacterium]|nr:hypothetical protein [Candidatus Hydrogenedentota bacterium]